METVYRRLQDMFRAVIQTEDFIVAPDPAGVFLFIGDGDAEEALIKAARVMKQLELTKKEVLICLVGQSDGDVCKTDGSESGPCLANFREETGLVYRAGAEELEAFITAAVRERGTVLSMACVDDIIGCYCDLPEMRAGLETALVRRGMDRAVAGRLARARPSNLEEVVQTGIPEEEADQVWKLIEDQYSREKSDSGELRYIGLPYGERRHVVIGRAVLFFAFVLAVVFVMGRVLGLFD